MPPPPTTTARWAQSLAAAFRPDGALRPFRLLRQDWRNLPRRYASDWRTFNQLVVASAVYVFFTNLLPGITFASDLYSLTGQNWGTIEVVLSTGLCGVVFSLFSIQPLTILGVTGPFSILAENMYSLCTNSFDIPFLPFMAWTLIHAAWMHYLLAIFNAHDWTMRYVTTFSTEIFSLLNSIIYVHKAIQELERARATLTFAAFLYSIIGAVGTCLVAIFLATADRWRPLFHPYIRMGLAEYAAAISIVLFVGLPHVGELRTLDKETLPISTAFRPTRPDRATFLVRFWELPAVWAAAALLPGAIVTALFFFDHEVSSIICTLDRYGTRQPGGFAWDVALLGTTTLVCGVLGIPPANGLLPQAPLHSESLIHDERETVVLAASADGEGGGGDGGGSGGGRGRVVTRQPRVSRRVYEQRWSHFLHAAGILACVSPPLMRVLGLTPTSVLAGLFLFMAEQSLSVNPILHRTFHLLTPASALPPLPPKIPTYRPIHGYTLAQILVTTAIFVLTRTVAGPAFPLAILLLVPLRLRLLNRLWDREVLRYVDAWACRDGTPEDEENRRGKAAGEPPARLNPREGDGDGGEGAGGGEDRDASGVLEEQRRNGEEDEEKKV